MGLKGMDTTRRRGAVAALIALSTGSALGAQVAVGTVQVRPGNPDDTAQMRVMMLMTKGRVDSLATLMREFNITPHGSNEWIQLKAKIDSLIPSRKAIFLRSDGPGGASAMPKGWIGINAIGPKTEMVNSNGYFVQYFDYPSIIAVDPDSPAQRAGILPGDVLVGYDGVDVRGHRFDLTQMLVPEKKLAVSIRRAGEAKDYTLTIVPAPVTVADRRRDIGQTTIRLNDGPAMGPGEYRIERTRSATVAGPAGGSGRVGALPLKTWVFGPNGALGAILSTVSGELAKSLKIDPGVLVTDVTDETPASRSGLKTGDVIVIANGQPLASLRQLQEVLMARSTSGERSVPLVVVREKHQQKIVVNW